MPILHIHTYDRGLFNYSYYPNYWILVDVYENETILTLKNYYYSNVIIDISSWKTTY